MLMKKLFTFLLMIVSFSSFAQDTLSYKSYRSVWSIVPRFGVGDKQTRSAFTTYGSIGLRREFSLGKLISLNATASYSSAYGRYGNPNLNVLAAGAGVTLYPFYLANIIVGKIFPNQKRNENDYKDFYFDETVEVNLNDSRYGTAGNIIVPRFEFNLGRYTLGKMSFLSPKLGLYFLLLEQPLKSNNLNNYSFFYLGAAIGFNPKPKTR